jgi:hypothetical protein
MRHRFTAGLLTMTLGTGLLAMGAPQAHASSKGRKNTAIGLGALAAYGLLSGKTGTGLIAGAGAAYAYKKYKDGRDEERRYDRRDRYYSRSGSRYRTNSTSRSGDFQFPVGYGGSGGQYQYGGNSDQYQYGGGQYQYDNGRYNGGQYQYDNGRRQYSRRENQRRYNSRYDDSRRNRSRYNRYDDDDDYRPRGWSRGNKRGWRGRSVPPGQYQKQSQWD